MGTVPAVIPSLPLMDGDELTMFPTTPALDTVTNLYVMYPGSSKVPLPLESRSHTYTSLGPLFVDRVEGVGNSYYSNKK
jgi:hypothetical protein